MQITWANLVSRNDQVRPLSQFWQQINGLDRNDGDHARHGNPLPSPIKIISVKETKECQNYRQEYFTDIESHKNQPPNPQCLLSGNSVSLEFQRRFDKCKTNDKPHPNGRSNAQKESAKSLRLVGHIHFGQNLISMRNF